MPSHCSEITKRTILKRHHKCVR